MVKTKRLNRETLQTLKIRVYKVGVIRTLCHFFSVSLNTAALFSGVIFKLDKETLHESLRLFAGNVTVKQNNMVHGNTFGTAFLADGCHFWTINIDSFKGENSFLAVGKLLSDKHSHYVKTSELVKYYIMVIGPSGVQFCL